MRQQPYIQLVAVRFSALAFYLTFHSRVSLWSVFVLIQSTVC